MEYPEEVISTTVQLMLSIIDKRGINHSNM